MEVDKAVDATDPGIGAGCQSGQLVEPAHGHDQPNREHTGAVSPKISAQTVLELFPAECRISNNQLVEFFFAWREPIQELACGPWRQSGQWRALARRKKAERGERPLLVLTTHKK